MTAAGQTDYRGFIIQQRLNLYTSFPPRFFPTPSADSKPLSGSFITLDITCAATVQSAGFQLQFDLCQRSSSTRFLFSTLSQQLLHCVLYPGAFIYLLSNTAV